MMLFDPNLPPLQKNRLVAERRYGKIFYTNQFMESAPEALQKIYSKIIPVAVEYDYAREMFEVTALSEHFEAVEEGQMIPYYHCVVSVQKRKNGSGKAYYFKFELIEV